MKREKTLEFVMSFPGWWKGKKKWKRLEIYILWNGTCYKEKIEICALENVYFFHKYLWALNKSL